MLFSSYTIVKMINHFCRNTIDKTADSTLFGFKSGACTAFQQGNVNSFGHGMLSLSQFQGRFKHPLKTPNGRPIFYQFSCSFQSSSIFTTETL